MAKTARLGQFFAQVGMLAKQLGIQAVVVAAKDPQTNDVEVVASPAGAEVVPAISERYNLQDAAEIGWTDT